MQERNDGPEDDHEGGGGDQSTMPGVDEVLATTRSVREGLDLSRPVERELIEQCIGLALQAPSGLNLQNAHFVVVTDTQKRRTLADIYRRGWEKLTQMPALAGALQFDDPARQAEQQRIIASANYLAEHIHEVPVLIVPCVDVGVGTGRVYADMGYVRGVAQPVLVDAAVWGAILPTAQHYRLAAPARGLGTCWTVVHLFFEEEAADVLGVPYDKVIQAGLFPMAHASDEWFYSMPRPPLSDVVHWESW